jgi:hypothetical protein
VRTTEEIRGGGVGDFSSNVVHAMNITTQLDTSKRLTSIALEVLIVAVYILYLSDRRKENGVVNASTRRKDVACFAVVVNNQQLGTEQ